MVLEDILGRGGLCRLAVFSDDDASDNSQDEPTQSITLPPDSTGKATGGAGEDDTNVVQGSELEEGEGGAGQGL